MHGERSVWPLPELTREEHRMGTTGCGTMAKIGVGGTIERDGAGVARRRVEGLGQFVVAARDLKLGWGQFPDDAEVIYLYDAGDGGFGHALNLACGWCSEWGYAPCGG